MTDELAGVLPPHELRAIGGNLVDRHDTRPLGPSLASTTSPGLSPAAVAPPSEAHVPESPAEVRPPTDASMPVELRLPMAMTGMPVSILDVGALVMMPSPTTGGAPSELHAPAPAVAPHAPPGAPDTPPPVSASHGSLDPLQALGGELRVPFMPGDLASLPGLHLAAQLAPPGVGTGAAMSPPGVPGAPQPVPAFDAGAFDVPSFGIERVSLIEDVPPTLSRAPELERVPLVDGTAPPFGGAAGRAPVPAVDLSDSPGSVFDPNVVRRDFPILEERVHGGKRVVWLDNAATTQKPRAVIDRLSYFYAHENSNVHRAAHALAARATDAYESARETTRKFLNAPSASEIVFVRGATEGINLIAKSWGKRYIERGDEILVTHLEHHANIVPWQQLCAEVGARLRVAPVDDRGDVMLDELERQMSSRTKLVAFTQVSNALGTVTPVKDIIDIAHRRGATVLLDGAQAVSHLPVDVQALDCDFYVFSGHKVFAPTGIGAVFGKRAILDAMPPWQGGGNMIADVTFERTLYQEPPWRFEAGTGNIADAAGMGAALDYVMRIGMPTIERYEHELMAYTLEQLATVRSLRFIGTPRERAGVVSFILEGRRTEDVGAALDKYGIAVRSGHHCAQPILRRFGVEATVRASLALYNIRADIDELVAALRQM